MTLATVNVDAEAQACARLVMAIVLQAIDDASSMPSRAEVEHRQNFNATARTALRWLFSGDTEFDLYVAALGLDVDTVRHKLLDPNATGMSPARRRWLRQRAAWAGLLPKEDTK